MVDGVAKSPISCVVAGSANAQRTLCTPARGRHHHASESHSVRLPAYRTFVLSHRQRIFMFLRVQQLSIRRFFLKRQGTEFFSRQRSENHSVPEYFGKNKITPTWPHKQ
ncbi:MAG: hypothetical protein ACOY3O_08940 [Thermodesulfobacteriota bacterium]